MATRNVRLFVFTLALVLLVGMGLTACQSDYVYDANSRLVAVINSDGSATKYHYDAVGNIKSIESLASGELAILSFSPSHAGPRDLVAIQGVGFSETAVENIVKFNGVFNPRVSATVLSASSTKIVASVPIFASSGPISVTVDGATTTSSKNFTVTHSPYINSFSPHMVEPGVDITMSGYDFRPIHGATKVSISGIYAPIVSVTDTQITFTVSEGARSGKLRITTPYGQGTSEDRLIVVPDAIGASNVISHQAMSANGAAKTLNINQSNQYGLFSFTAEKGAWLSLQLTSLSTAPSGRPVSYKVYSPANTQIASGWVSMTNRSIHLPQIPVTGPYLIVFGSGNNTVQLTAGLEIDPGISANGAITPISTSDPYQSKRIVFGDFAGLHLGLGILDLNLTPNSQGNHSVSFELYGPNGNRLDYFYCDEGNSCGHDLNNMPASGTYQIVATPEGSDTVNFKAILSTDKGGTLDVSSTQSLDLRSGQNGQLHFSATTGQTVAVRVSGVSTTPFGDGVDVTIYRPDGTRLTSRHITTASTFNLPDLVAGNYQVFVDPRYGAAAQMQVTLAAGVTETLSVGSSRSVSTTVPDQNMYLSFSATAGQTMAMRVAGVRTTPPGAGVDVTIYRSDGTRLTSRHIATASTFNLPDLVAGNYQVFVDPRYGATAQLQVELAPGATETLRHGGSGQSVTTVRNQNVYMNFTARPADDLELKLAITLEPNTDDSIGVDFYLYGPGGGQLSHFYCGEQSFPDGSTGGHCVRDLYKLPLPATGTYRIKADPEGSNTMTLKWKLDDLVCGTLYCG